jgi:hypothetical protein
VETHENENVIDRPTGVPMIVDAEPISEGDAPTTGLPISITINSDDQLIIAGEAAVERFKESREQILPMARGLAAAKRKYPATQEFRDWLRGSPYLRIDKQDRAALINIGKQLDEHESRVVELLKTTNLISPQSIWAEIRKELQPPPPTVDSSYYDNNSGDGPIDVDRSEFARLLKASGNNLKKIKLPDPPADDESTESEPADTSPAIKGPTQSKAQPVPHELYGTGKRFDLVVLTPGKDDLARLRDANLDKLGECLPVREHVGDAAAIVIAAKVADLPVVIDRLLPLCGFNRPKRILLLGQPASPDVIGAKVLVTAERGDIAFCEPPEVWLDDAADPIDAAEGLYEASSTLHLFATAKAKRAERRCVIVGNDGWKKLPVVS